MTKIITEGFNLQRQHKKEIGDLFNGASETIDVASAYVTNTKLFETSMSRCARLLTALSTSDIISGATSIEAIRWLFENGVNIRIVPSSPKFHAKVYIADRNKAIVSSANLTHNGIENNIEVGVLLDESESIQLSHWFESTWNEAIPLSVEVLDSLRDFSHDISKELSILNEKTRKLDKQLNQKIFKSTKHRIMNLDDGSRQFFICNSDRRNGIKTESGAYLHEETMLSLGVAMAWETFSFTEHMLRAKKGDVIFLFAKGKGIIAIGEVQEKVHVVTCDETNKQFCPEVETPEWRIAVSWLTQRDDLYAFPLSNPPRWSFLDISDEKYCELKSNVLSFFSEVGSA